MKIRIGFVSNSSSSSFCLIGSEACDYGNEIIELGKTLNLKFKKKKENEDEWENNYENRRKTIEALELLGMEVYEGEEHIVFGYKVETDTTIDSQIEWVQNEFNKLGINKRAYFDYGEINNG